MNNYMPTTNQEARKVSNFNVKGKVTQGKYSGWFVLIQPFPDNQKGCLLLISKNGWFGRAQDGTPDGDEGYDNFFLTCEDAALYIHKSDWDVVWLET